MSSIEINLIQNKYKKISLQGNGSIEKIQKLELL